MIRFLLLPAAAMCVLAQSPTPVGGLTGDQTPTTAICGALSHLQSDMDEARQSGDTLTFSRRATVLAEALAQPMGQQVCPELRYSAVETYDLAIGGAVDASDISQQALARNAKALYLLTTSDPQRFTLAIDELRKAQTAIEGSVKGSTPDSRDLATYQYNLGRVYERVGGRENIALAILEYRKALYNRPDLEEAARQIFGLLGTARGLDPSAPIQGAELAGIIVSGGQAELAATLVIGLLNEVYAERDAQVLVGALLRAYLALPLHACDQNLDTLVKIAAKSSGRNSGIREAVTRLTDACHGATWDVRAAESYFGSWLRGPTEIAALAELIERRGEEAELQQHGDDAIRFYSTAWYLDPANTRIALRCASLLATDRNLREKNYWLPQQMMDLYLPLGFREYVLSVFLDSPMRSELRFDADDRQRVMEIYKLLFPEKDLPRRLQNRETLPGTAAAPISTRGFNVVDGDRIVRGSVNPASGPQELEKSTAPGSTLAPINAVQVEVESPGSAPTLNAVEVAIAPVNPDTGEFSVSLVSELKAGQRVTVYGFRLGVRLEDALFSGVTARRPLGDVRHLHIFGVLGGQLAQERNSAQGQSIYVLRSSFSFLADSSFRFNNHGQPYLPRGNGYLVATYGSFSLDPVAVTTSTGVVQAGHARTLDVGVYVPLYAARSSWIYQGYPHTIFLAPMVRGGFSATGGENERTFYNFFATGVRLGQYRFYRYGEKAPELGSHIDVTAGRWANLATFQANDVTTPWRLEVAGTFMVPSTSAWVGFRQTFGPGYNDSRVFIGIRLNFSELLPHRL